VARWLAEQGARRLILLGRTPLPPRRAWATEADPQQAARIHAVRGLEALGACVHTAAVDVADEAALRGFLRDYADEGWPPIRGVVHAAGLIRDRTLAHLDAAAFGAVLRPKLIGGWLLHTLLLDTELDFFVLFSSATSLTGAAGQGNYAAANAALDALAHHRRALGLPALSINWGPWAEVGIVARDEDLRTRAQHRVGTISAQQGVEFFGRLIHHAAPQVGVVPLEPWRLRELLPPGAP
jgi:NAD(P)-dependent dehydrogenase (short-subunit alcohol dehydrogenase family)